MPALRSIGDRAWKGSMGGLAGSLKLVRSVPETRYTAAWIPGHLGELFYFMVGHGGWRGVL